MSFDSLISDAVSFIESSESSRASSASYILSNISKLNFSFPFMFESFISKKIEPSFLNFSVAGVDSGFVLKKLASLDFLIVRSVGVLFSFEDNKLHSSKYVPSFYSFPEPRIIKSSLEFDESMVSQSLLRLKEEVSTSIELIKSFSPKYLFIDGSILPQYADKPRKDSSVHSLYLEIISLFEELYSVAFSHSCTLISCVEDSRGTRAKDILQSLFSSNNLSSLPNLESTFDISLLDYLLNKDERSFVFPYSENSVKHPILTDFSPRFSNNFFGFYIKPSLFDRPLRVEFLNFDRELLSQQTDEIASVVLSLSSLHREYAYPSVLIEADFHAKLRSSEIDLVFNKIWDKLGRNTKLRLRREIRPF